MDAAARAQFHGLSSRHDFNDLMRAVYEGLGFAARDCYAAMGPVPPEVRITGGAARSKALRTILGRGPRHPDPDLDARGGGCRRCRHDGGRGDRAFPDMERCIDRWVTPTLGDALDPDPALADRYDRLFPAYVAARKAAPPVWHAMRDGARRRRPGGRGLGRTADPRTEHDGEPAMTDHGTVDLAVIGGGVNGAGIARDAAGRGLSVLLCEKGDLAEGTSSRSGKLVHGGLRYLEYYEFRLVREALIEREVLLRAAPHIIWPMRFVLPHSPEQRPAWMVRTGLFLYDHLGGRKMLPGSRKLDLRKAPEGRRHQAGLHHRLRIFATAGSTMRASWC